MWLVVTAFRDAMVLSAREGAVLVLTDCVVELTGVMVLSVAQGAVMLTWVLEMTGALVLSETQGVVELIQVMVLVATQGAVVTT